MAKDNKLPDGSSDLRKRAEGKLRKQAGESDKNPPADLKRTFHELEVHQIELEMQNDELRRTQQDLATSREKYFDLYDLAPVGYVTLNEKGLIQESNLTVATLLGTERSNLVRQPLFRFIYKEDQQVYDLCHRQLLKTHSQQACEMRMVRMDGAPFWVRIDISEAQGVADTTVTRMVIIDISKRKQAERRRALLAEILGILNDPLIVDDAINRIITEIKSETGFDAVGIRLHRGDDFPYVAQDGFSKEFLLTENTLAVRTRDGGVCVDKDGNINLECTCGLVISGQTDSAKLPITPKGSFWTNESSVLLDIPIARDPRLHPRNRCIHEGFHSVALIPLRAGKRILGLLQLNHRRPHRFTPEMISFFEDLGVTIGIALARKQAEDALRESEQKYRELFDNMIEGFAYCKMIFVDGKPQDFIYLTVNNAFETLTGLKNVTGKRVTEVIPGIRESDQELLKIYGRVSLTGKSERFEMFVEALKMWFSVSVYSRERGFFVAIFDNITERKKAEEIQGRLAAIVESAEDAIISKDVNGIIQTWNVGAENIYGYKAEEAIGKPISILVPPGHTDEIPEILRRIEQGEHIEGFETVRMRKDGTIIPVYLTFSAIKDRHGNVIGTSKIAHDISMRKQSEERIRTLIEQLNHQVAELDAFAYSVAHDLNAPLRHMTGFVKLLQQRLEDYPDAKTRDYMDAISEASTKMSMLIEDLLNFSRLGRSEMKMRKVKLNTLMGGIVGEIQSELKEREIRWEIDELPDVLGDPSLLRLVMVNLISNAVKFTSTRSQAEIRIGCNDDGDKFTCSVTDNGVGFDMEYVGKLFGVFQRLHPQSEFKGTGIGLANVQRIITRHGGRVWAEGAVGQGATFYFTLPKIKEA